MLYTPPAPPARLHHPDHRGKTGRPGPRCRHNQPSHSRQWMAAPQNDTGQQNDKRLSRWTGVVLAGIGLWSICFALLTRLPVT